MKKQLQIILLFLFIGLIGSCQTTTQVWDRYTTVNTIPTIDFMQDWYFMNYRVDEFIDHFTKLKEIGIDTVILQSTAELENGKVTLCHYDSSYARKENANVRITNYISNVMDAALTTNTKVIIGLSMDGNWWNAANHLYNDSVIEAWIQMDKAMIQELSQLYTPSGWYFSYEMYSNTKSYETSWAKMVKSLVDEINNLTPSLPLYMSPFHSTIQPMNLATTEKMWANFFDQASLRDIDVFAPQDGFGGTLKQYQQKISEKTMEIIKVMQKACKKHSKAKFSINIEMFASDGLGMIDRVAAQIALANQLTDNLLCFSASHYYLVVEPKQYEDYLAYIKTEVGIINDE